MGKNLNQQESGLSLENYSPGCMWGILNHFHHNRWHHGKKRLTRKAHGSGKHDSADQESIRTSSDASEGQESIHSSVENSTVETKTTIPSPPPKNSMKSRIKSLITEEMSKRKGRHRRSTSYPTRAPLNRTISIHHRESSGIDLAANNNPNDDLLGFHDSVHSNLTKLGEENGSKIGSCELCTTMLKLNYLKQSEVNKLVRQPVRDHTLLRDKLIYAIEQTKCDSLQESKLFMDALDLLNLRKEVFLKILQDPMSSSLAHQLHRRRAPNVRFGLTKSVSFPVSGSSDRSDFELNSNNLSTVKGSFSQNGSPQQFSRELVQISDNVLKRRDNNKVVVLKRFKNLREKIKHVIRDRKKEKDRIIMDAVHHKIPYGHRYNKEDKFSNYSSQQLFKRTSSFDESYNRYNRLLDINLNKEAKDHTDSVRFRTSDNNSCSSFPSRPAVFKRILSLPDLRSYSSIQIEDSSNTSSFHTADIVSEGIISEQKPFDIGLENNKVQPMHAVSESASQENLFDVGSTFEDSVDNDSKAWETASSDDLNLEAVPSLDRQPLDSDRVSEDELDYEEDEIEPVSVSEDTKFPTEDDPAATQHDLTNLNNSCVASENIAGTDTLESQALKKLYEDLLHVVHVDTNNKAEFNYVKDVLDLSGFTRDELLGKWYSAEHPVDPLVFDEVEGCCLVSQPECSGNEEGGTCDHLLLFDLINEVLLDIHERSFYYWPVPLAVQSRIHQMPKGYHVLEEVWAEISWLLRWRPEIDQSIDDAVGRDLGKYDCWMNLQMDAEFVGLEVEDLIFDDLLEEIVSI